MNVDDMKARLRAARPVGAAPVQRIVTLPPRPPVPALATTAEEAAAKIKALTTRTLEKRAPHLHHEIRRICGLPLAEPMTEEELDAFSEKEVLARAFNGDLADGSPPFRLRPNQADALMHDDLFGCYGLRDGEVPIGLFLPQGVGKGKSLLSYMLVERAHRAGVKRSMLVIPAQVYAQATDPKRGSIRWARDRVPLSVPFHEMGGSSKKRAVMASSGWTGCYIVPYSLLSCEDTSKMLDDISPQMIVCDEAHNLKNHSSARTKRVMRFIEDKAPKFCAMSGTITGKGIKDYWHLIKAALNPNCPLPLGSQQCDEWGQVLDTDVEPSPAQFKLLDPLVEWAREHPLPPTTDPETGAITFEPDFHEEDVSSFRRAYKRRLTTCPGVVATGEDDLQCSLILRNRPVDLSEDDPTAVELKRLMKGVEDGRTPSGDIIEHAIHGFHWLLELTAGFYSSLYWPTVEDFAAKRGFPESVAKDVLERAKVHYEATQDYAKALRTWLKDHARPGADAPMLVAGWMARHGGIEHSGTEHGDLYSLWTRAKALDFEERPDRWSTAKRVCDYKIRRAVEWARELPNAPGCSSPGGIVWFHHNEIGQWVAEALYDAGFPVYLATAGKRHNQALLDIEARQGQIVCASISAHGVGKELQYFEHQIVLQWPRDARLAEQMLGRTHRWGQRADELVVDRMDSTSFDRGLFAACLNDSVYIHQTTGAQQKLVYAGYDPIPPVYPYEWLIERGYGGDRLTKEASALLKNTFGDPSTEATKP